MASSEKQILHQIASLLRGGNIAQAMNECSKLSDKEAVKIDKILAKLNIKHFVVHSEMKLILMGQLESLNLSETF